jgi:hypothetical protein
MSMMRKLLEAVTKFAGEPEQKPGEQWKGTDKGTPGNKLVGGESVLKDLSKGKTLPTTEEKLAEEWANFNEDDLGVEPKRPHRTGSRADKIGARGHKEQPRYTTVKDEVDEATAAELKVGDHVTANTSKDEYPGGHKSRAGKVTRVGQTGVHIRPDDGGEVEYHPYKIVKKTVKDIDVDESTSIKDKRNGKKQLQVNAIFDDGTHLTDLFIIDKDVEANEYRQLQSFVKQRAQELGKTGKITKIQYKPWPALSSGSYNGTAGVGRLAEDSLDDEYEGGESDNDYFDRQKPKKLSKRSQQRDNAADARKIGSFSVDGKVVRSNVNGLDHKQVAKELSNKYPGKNIEWNMTSKPFNEGWNTGSDRVHLSDSTSAYWGGTGRLQAEYDELYKQLVPASGAAETLEGEVIRASSKIVYRHFNDGDEFNKASFDQLKPFIGSVTSYDDLAEKAIEFALKAQGNYHPNAGWDSLDVMDYGPSEEEEYDDEEDDENDYQDWEDPNEDNLEEGEHDAEFIDHEDNWYNMADWARAEFNKGKSVEEVIKYLRDNDYLGPRDINTFMQVVTGEKWNEVSGEKWNESADMFKAGQRAIKNIKSTEQQRKSEANKMAQAQSQIDVDRENERDRFSQEELYPSDDSHDLDEGAADVYSITSERNGRERSKSGTLAELIEYYGYTLETGKSYERERGNSKINLNPKNIESLVQNLNNAKDNAAANGSSNERFYVDHGNMAEGKHFRTAYGWAGGRNEKTGKMYKHPDQIKADREAKKAATAQQSKDAFNDMLGGNAADLTRDLKIREATGSDKLVARAHAIIRKHGDADMGHSEFMQLLTANGIPKEVAHQVASDYRPVSEGSSSYPTDANWDRSGQMDPLAKGIGPSRTRANPKSTAKDIEQANYQTKRAIKGRLGKEVAEGWGADTQKAESDRSAAAWDTLRAKYATDPAVIKRLNYLERMNWTAAAAEKKANAGEIKGVAESKADTTGSWVVHSGSKVKRFKTRDGAKAYAEKNGGKVASSEFYADKVQKDINEDVTSTDPLEGALLNAIQELVSQGHKDVDPMVLTNMVVAATSRPFLLKDLVDANNNSLAVQHYIDSISPSKVKFSTDTLTVKNEDPSKDKAKARAGVSSMASRAANRSRLGENSVTPLRDKEDYTAKRKALQDIQLDPDTNKDPQLKAELARRLGSLNQQYTDLQSKLREFKESRGHKAIATKLGNIDRMQNVQIPSPAERREQLRIAKAKEEVGKKQVKEFAAPGANPAPVVAPANDPAAKQQAQKIATATNTIKSATGSTVAAPVLATALDAASQGQANPAQVKAIAPIANVVDAATKDPKLAGQFKTLATQAQQSLKAQQKPQ